MSRRGIFGWSYPPGCSGPPEDDYPDDAVWDEIGVHLDGQYINIDKAFSILSERIARLEIAVACIGLSIVVWIAFRGFIQ